MNSSLLNILVLTDYWTLPAAISFFPARRTEVRSLPKYPCATICYMEDERERVGVRELRQNLSVYLRRVASGETLEVTERNRAVAILAPLPEASTPLGRLGSTGRATAPIGDLLDLDPPEGEVSTRLSDALEREREERLP